MNKQNNLLQKILVFLILVLLMAPPAFNRQKELIKTGADVLISKKLDLIYGKKLGIVTNHTALLSNGTHFVDSLVKIPGITVTALFGPEHGIRGNAPDGEKIDSGIDKKTGIKIYSLYGAVSEPTKEMLKDVDVLVFDIQDVGARFYTYISTLFKILQCSAENNIPVIVLDRPNPINGVYVDGPIRKDSLSSFVGIAPIPIAHGMTVGELAELFCGEHYIGNNLKPELTVIKLEGWDRNKYFDDYALTWIDPSPNMPSVQAEIVYPGTCILEGTNVTEGRGTTEPFLTIGAPFITPNKLIDELKSAGINGIELEPVEFTPVAIPGKTDSPKFKNKLCKGIHLKVTDRSKFESVKFGVKLVSALHKLYPEQFAFGGSFNRLCGDGAIKEMIKQNKTPEYIINYWQDELKNFLEIRKKYLLY